MTFMGFSLTCGVLSGLILSSNANDLSVAGTQSVTFYTRNDESFQIQRVPITINAKHKEEVAVMGSIYAFTVVELILAMWSVALCFINDHQPTLTNEPVS